MPRRLALNIGRHVWRKVGVLGGEGIFPNELCFQPTVDVGKSCAKAGDCEGHCDATSKTCSPETPQFGCFDILDENGVAVGLCVD